MSNPLVGGLKTLRIVRLLDTRVRLLRLELVGQEQPLMSQVGVLVLFVPFLAIGYAFLLAALARVLARGLGWTAALFLIGVVHLALGTWGVWRARFTSSITSFEVVDPECASPEERDGGGSAGTPNKREARLSAAARATVAFRPFEDSDEAARPGSRAPQP
jgi:hypothetical protein